MRRSAPGSTAPRRIPGMRDEACAVLTAGPAEFSTDPMTIGAADDRPAGLTIVAILPTFNRAELLGKALDSALAAAVPDGSEVCIVVVDNNSTDRTREIVAGYIERHGPRRVRYLFEPRQGRQFALNRGIADTSSDIVAMFDDDEILESTWFEVIADCFKDQQIDFIGGPYRPDWSAPAPEWLPENGYGGVLGIIDNGPTRRRYDSPGFGAMLSGGNSAIRRRALEKCGPYSDSYMYAEDRYMYGQLCKTGAVGYYIPELVIYHHIPEKRLNKAYFRHWALTEGGNRGAFAVGDGARHWALGAPLWMWRRTAEAALRICLGHASGRANRPQTFKAELDCLQFAGFLRGRLTGPARTQRFDRS